MFMAIQNCDIRFSGVGQCGKRLVLAALFAASFLDHLDPQFQSKVFPLRIS